MRRLRFDLNLLIALRVLLTERSVTRAAESLHVSQPAMSATLGRLREYFDDPLIRPIGRRMELTPLGQSLLDPVGDVLVRIDVALQTVARFDAATSRRRFLVVASDYVFNALLRPVIEHVRRFAPEVSLHLVPPDDAVAAALDAGEVDLLVLPERYAAPDHPSSRLFEDDHVLVADAANDAIGDTIDLEAFVACRHVTYDHHARSYFDDWFERTHDKPRRVDLVVHSFLQVAQVVAGTPRVAVLLGRLARELREPLGLKLATLGFGSPTLTIILQWHRHRDLDPGLQWLRQVVLDEAARLPPLEALNWPVCPVSG